MHHALEPPTLGDARDLDAVPGGKNRYGYRLARLGRLSCRWGDREALQYPRRRLEACFLYMTGQGLRRPLGHLRTETQLDLRPAHLHNETYTRLLHDPLHICLSRVEHADPAQLGTPQ